MRYAFIVCALGASLSLAGCRLFTDFGDFEITEDAGVQGSPVDLFKASLARAVCDRALACERKNLVAADQQMACGHETSPQDSMFEHYLARFAPELEARFDETLAATCLADVAGMACHTETLPRSCAFLRVGTGAASALCTEDSDCASGRCVGNQASCGSRTCAALAALTEACSDSWDCAAGLVCAGGTCITPEQQTSACTSDTECAAGLWCNDIDGTGACEAIPDQEGDACALHDGLDHCIAGLYCISGMCVRGAAVGMTCDATHPCAPNARCVGALCVAIGGDTEACTTRNDCPGFFDCVAGRCTARPVEGEACNANQACTVGVCTNGTCHVPRGSEQAQCIPPTLPFVPVCDGYCNAMWTPNRCDSRLVAGSGCVNDSDCASGACVGPEGSRVCETCGG
jgi:hypothetical protein